MFTKVAGTVTQHHLVRRYFSHNRPMIFTAMGIFMDVPVPISSRGFQHDFPIKKLNVLSSQKRQTKCVVSCSDMPKPAEKPGMSGDTERGEPCGKAGVGKCWITQPLKRWKLDNLKSGLPSGKLNSY